MLRLEHDRFFLLTDKRCNLIMKLILIQGHLGKETAKKSLTWNYDFIVFNTDTKTLVY